ncbi:MAG: hypothetical protein CPDRYMAC_0788 [uncultured Paraburkholderia sp.]|nr:MAG: hypothetical protein CPDRYDRY_0826 [uncultured Paraburkholderia sp.]CAH2913945.1 MAG: hypothetical protein CPDRYMAC_0788 [uncultured Paraburkholderia sp.]
MEHVMTGKKEHASHPTPTAADNGPPLESVESRLDEALEESFPASDPVAIDSVDPNDPRVKAAREGKK